VGNLLQSRTFEGIAVKAFKKSFKAGRKILCTLYNKSPLTLAAWRLYNLNLITIGPEESGPYEAANIVNKLFCICIIAVAFLKILASQAAF